MTTTVKNTFGTYDYIPTLLEEFVERFARNWGVKLSDMAPAQAESNGPYLERCADTEKVLLQYIRKPSEQTLALEPLGSEYLGRIASHLYADNDFSSEQACLNRGDKVVTMEFVPDGMKNVSFWVPQLFRAIKEADKHDHIRGITKDDAVVRLDFYRSAGNQPNPVGDMQNAFNVIERYFKR